MPKTPTTTTTPAPSIHPPAIKPLPKGWEKARKRDLRKRQVARIAAKTAKPKPEPGFGSLVDVFKSESYNK